MKHSIRLLSFLALSVLVLTGCEKSSKPTLKIAASSVPHAEILEFIRPALKKDGVDLEILTVDDYQTPNRALSDGEVDANFFQHFPFLKAQTEDFGYKLEPLVAVHLEPMGLYSRSVASTDSLKDGAKIAVPSDPSNQARALALLEREGLITLSDRGSKTSVLNITENPHRFRLIEIDAPLLAHSLQDVDLAAINANVAMAAGLTPQKDALSIENGHSDYVNLVVIRRGESDRQDLQTLKKELTNDKVRSFISEHYKGALSPAF